MKATFLSLVAAGLLAGCAATIRAQEVVTATEVPGTPTIMSDSGVVTTTPVRWGGPVYYRGYYAPYRYYGGYAYPYEYRYPYGTYYRAPGVYFRYGPSYFNYGYRRGWY